MWAEYGSALGPLHVSYRQFSLHNWTEVGRVTLIFLFPHLRSRLFIFFFIPKEVPTKALPGMIAKLADDKL